MDGMTSLSMIEEDGDSCLRALSQSCNDSSDLRRRLQDVVDGDLAQDRRRQVEDLTSKVLSLELERDRARDELKFTEKQYHNLVEDAKVQLKQVRSEHARMEAELESLMQKLLESTERSVSLESEAQRLKDLRASTEKGIDSMQSELQGMQKKIHNANAKRMRALEESGVSSQTAQVLRDSLEAAKQQLADSEQQRARLREKYLNAGKQFEQVMGTSESEKQEVFEDLQQELTLNRKRCEKYKQRLQEAEKELRVVEANVESQREVLDDKDADIAQLQQALYHERTLQQEREAQHLEYQQRQLREQSYEMQAFSEMISLSSHQKLLEDQASRYREKMHKLELKLKQDKQECLMLSPYRPSNSHVDSLARYAPAQNYELSLCVSPAQPVYNISLHEETFRPGLREEGIRQFRAKALKLESEYKQVKQTHRRAEAAASKA